MGIFSRAGEKFRDIIHNKKTKEAEESQSLVLDKKNQGASFRSIDPVEYRRLMESDSLPVATVNEGTNDEDIFIPKVRSPERVSFLEAKRIMTDKYFHDRKSIAHTFDTPILNIPEAPPIPFSNLELEQARKDGCILIFRVSKTKDGVPLTIHNMDEMNKEKNGKLLYYGRRPNFTYEAKGYGWYNEPGKEEDFYSNETCRDGWALVQIEPQKNSLDHNYWEQTEMLVEKARQIYKYDTRPQEIKDAIDEFNQEKQQLVQLLSDMHINNENWTVEQKILLANKLASLKINQLMRRNSTEVIFDMAVHYANSNKRVLYALMHDWTITVSSTGALVDCGAFDFKGAIVHRNWPYYPYRLRGVAISRSISNLSITT